MTNSKKTNMIEDRMEEMLLEMLLEAADRVFNEIGPDEVRLSAGRIVSRRFYRPEIHGKPADEPTQ